MNGMYTQRKSCAQLREQGLASLRGKWGIAILAMLIATILGAQLATTSAGSSGFSFDFNFDFGSESEFPGIFEDGENDIALEELANLTVNEWIALLGLEPGMTEGFGNEYGEMTIPELGTLLTEDDWATIGAALVFVLVFVVIGVVIGLALSLAFSLFVGAPVRVGHLRLRMELIDGEPGKIETLFGGFGKGYWRYVGLSALKMLYLLLWGIPATIFTWVTLIAMGVSVFQLVVSIDAAQNIANVGTPLLVMGLAMVFMLGFSLLPTIARYRYAMSDYIIAENPDMTVGDALKESVRMMKGNKWRLFCLELSFIGWVLLCILSCGIGFIWLSPYMYQTEAAFYHEISGRAAIREAVVDMKEWMTEL